MSTDKEKLKRFMAQYNLKQSQLANKINIKQQVISRLLNDDKQEEATAALKYGLLKYYQYDIESDSYINRTENSTYTETVAIPFYSAKAAAGKGYENVDYPEKDVLFFDRRWLENVLNVHPENLSIVQAEGDSMLPDIYNGDLLLVDNSIINIINNKTFVIRQENQLRVKKLKKELDGSIWIISNNPNYPAECMDKETIILGRVIWNGSKENV